MRISIKFLLTISVTAIAFSATAQRDLSTTLNRAADKAHAMSGQTQQSYESAKEIADSNIQLEERKRLLDDAAAIARPGTLNLQDQEPAAIPNLIDPDVIAKQYAEVSAPQKDRDDEMTELMIFVSMSMPEKSLERIAVDAKRLGASIIIKGAPNGIAGGWNKSVKALEPMTKQGVEVAIHPDAFDRYDVERVPALVVAPDPIAGCTADACSPYAIVYGDVSMEYALEKLRDRNDSVGLIARRSLGME